MILVHLLRKTLFMTFTKDTEKVFFLTQMNIFCPANLFKGYLKIADPPPPPLKINSDHHIRNINKFKKNDLKLWIWLKHFKHVFLHKYCYKKYRKAICYWCYKIKWRLKPNVDLSMYTNKNEVQKRLNTLKKILIVCMHCFITIQKLRNISPYGKRVLNSGCSLT